VYLKSKLSEFFLIIERHKTSDEESQQIPNMINENSKVKPCKILSIGETVKQGHTSIVGGRINWYKYITVNT
jgi:hypothetical protein